MSQSPHVLITAGFHASPKLPKQDYDNVFVKYNIGPPASDAAFFNASVSEGLPDGVAPMIYGFFNGRTSFTEEGSLQKVVSFFQKSDLIDLVICDFSVKQNGFDSYHYSHSTAPPIDIPFFVHARAIAHISFSDDPIFQTQLQNMRNKSCPLFHIAEPILTLDNRL